MVRKKLQWLEFKLSRLFLIKKQCAALAAIWFCGAGLVFVPIASNCIVLEECK